MKTFNLILILLYSICSFGQKIDLNDRLRLEFLFKGNTDDSGPLGINGVIHGDVTYTPDRYNNPNSAALFDGDMDYIIVPKNDKLNFGKSDFSIAFWFKTNYSGSQMMIMKGNDSPPNYAQYWVRLNSTWDNYALVFLAGDDFPPSSIVSYQYSETISDDTWHHIAGVREGTAMSLYVDGELVNSEVQTIENVDNVFDMIIGAQFPRAEYYYHNFFKGALDDIRIYARALNECEVEALFSGKFPPER